MVNDLKIGCKNTLTLRICPSEKKKNLQTSNEPSFTCSGPVISIRTHFAELFPQIGRRNRHAYNYLHDEARKVTQTVVQK